LPQTAVCRCFYPTLI